MIVVDNNSDDDTVRTAKKFTSKVFSLPKNKNFKNFRGAQVNFGVKKSTGSIIFFPDADMSFEKDLIREAVVKLSKFDALFVPEVVIGKGFFGKVRNFERSFYNATCVDGVRFVRKFSFDKVGGFDVKNIVFGPDDWDLTKSFKKTCFKIGITKKSLFHHEAQLSLKTYFDKKKNYAGTFDGYIDKWGVNDIDIKKQFSPFYRLFGVFTENGKWINLLKKPHLVVGMYYLRLKVGFNYLLNKNLRRKD